MLKRVAVILLALGLILGGVYYYLAKVQQAGGDNEELLVPFGKTSGTKAKTPEELQKEASVFYGKKVLNVLLIGSDTSIGRKGRGQLGFNTDVLVLVSVNPEKNTVLLTSVPRDLWVNENKINALYTVYGWETLKDAFEKISGQKVDGYILVDFDGFRWVVDAFGGVPVEIKTTFTDENFPNIQDSGPITVSFTQGQEKMAGERALTYARSRKGNNGEGSDLMRAKRQHLILQGMVKAISQPESIFWPMVVPDFYQAVTQHMATSLKLEDVYYLWDFYKDRDKYAVESFVVGGDYLYHPGMYPESPYHAWVFIPIGNSFTKLNEDITSKINGTFVSSSAPSDTANTPSGTGSTTQVSSGQTTP